MGTVHLYLFNFVKKCSPVCWPWFDSDWVTRITS